MMHNTVIFNKTNIGMSLYNYIKESLGDKPKKKKKSPVDLVSKSKLIPSDIVNHLDEYNKEFKEWFEENCECEQSTLMDFAKYIPESENIDELDVAKWMSQNLESLLGGKENEETVEEPEEEPEEEPNKDTEKAEPKAEPKADVKESKDEQVKKADILDGTPPVSAIFCHAPEDNEYYCVIWSRLDSNDENWVKLKEAYKYLKEKDKLDILAIAPYDVI